MATPYDDIHIIPRDDLRPHDESADCWCRPTRDDQEPLVLIHHSMDGRERFETGERVPS